MGEQLWPAQMVISLILKGSLEFALFSHGYNVLSRAETKTVINLSLMIIWCLSKKKKKIRLFFFLFFWNNVVRSICRRRGRQRWRGDCWFCFSKTTPFALILWVRRRMNQRSLHNNTGKCTYWLTLIFVTDQRLKKITLKQKVNPKIKDILCICNVEKLS